MNATPRLLGQVTVSLLLAIPMACVPSNLEFREESEEVGHSQIVSLQCPDGLGICTWSRQQGWKPLFTGPQADSLRSFWQPSSGGAVALFRGHQDEGMVAVIASDGRLITARYLSMALGLSVVSTETIEGDIVLCNATRSEETCDIQVYGNVAHGLSLGSNTLPLDCLVPRFVKQGGAICFRRVQSGVAYRVIDSDGRFTDSPFPQAWLPDDVVRLGPHILLQKWNKLYYWDGQSLDLYETDQIRWVEKGSESAFVAICEESEERSVNSCRLEEIDKQLNHRTIWRSSTLYPKAVRALAKDLVLLDTSNGDERELLLLDLDRKISQETVWSKEK